LARAVAIAICDVDVGVDAVDEAMARAAQRWDQVAAYDAPQGWVYRVALNWARSILRRQARHWLRAPSAVHWDQLPNPDVNRAVAGLPERQRVVVVARFYLDWRIDQIAAALDVPVGTVKSRLSRALDRLAKELGVTRGTT
jgi:RNA polymerase sigma-70 factor (ECF subfamily)